MLMGLGEKHLISYLQDMLFYLTPTRYKTNIDQDIKSYCYCLIFRDSANLYCQLVNLKRGSDRILKPLNQHVLYGLFEETGFL